jgi:nucleoside-diphosphate-sugar epimerase/glycosyltransferase involved in cell wall biosynthesis
MPANITPISKAVRREPILVTGGKGFIVRLYQYSTYVEGALTLVSHYQGGHVARALLREGHPVRAADLPGQSHWQDVPHGIEIIEGDLRDRDFCQRAVRGMAFVLHFAANMGGMGVIHEKNELEIYRENHTMLLNVLETSIAMGVEKFLYASSACVYPQSLQQSGHDVSLAEDNVWQAAPPQPQGLYGLEKLCSELVVSLGAAHRLQAYTVRFHNIYGPHGSWRDGREKAPAALLRKAIAAKESGNLEVEIWGDGSQRRSFCYIDDAVEGVLKLLRSDCHVPVNIGSEEAVSINDLAHMAAAAVGLEPNQLRLQHILDHRLLGVGSRNSNNARAQELLGWTPRVSLQDGLQRTGQWIEGEFRSLLQSCQDDHARTTTVQSLRNSDVVHLRPAEVIFALLLPITSRGSHHSPSSLPTCLVTLRAFAASLLSTIASDTTNKGARFCFRVYLAVDDDDEALWDGQNNLAERTLHEEGIADVYTLRCEYPRGHVCSLWRHLARKAWEDGCDYFVLLGDDITLHSTDWMGTIDSTFDSISQETGLPFGLGCVAFKDTTFPGMPTFPVVHRTHMSIFHGQVVPDIFVNQDGDPFLYQLYRRFGCSRMVDCEIRNAVGGSDDARYEKQHAKDWTLGTLTEATCVVDKWIRSSSFVPAGYRKVTIDIIIPCYRVMLPYLDAFLALEASPTCSVMFIIIVDDPASPNICELKKKYEERLDVRIRVNKENLGASASRNRGLQESSSEWVLFLDDDVEPKPDILKELEKRIRAFPNAAGFVGNAYFPTAETVFTAAVHLAGVTYFWDIASKMPDSVDVPWGVTANLAARRDIKDRVLYNLGFPKTGGGEDIDYCRKMRDIFVSRGKEGFVAAPQVAVTHPYWNNGRRSYWRFYNWSKGDGALVKQYPELVYLDVPNSAELMFFSLLSLCLAVVALSSSTKLFALYTVVSIFSANVLHDVYRHLYRDADRTRAIKTTVTGSRWVVAVLESSLIRMFSEWGRLVGLVERGEWSLMCHRFDWFAGVYGDSPRREERKNNVQRITLAVALLALFVTF